MNRRIAYILVIIAPFILFLPEIVAQNSIFWGLPILQFYPWRELAFDQLISGKMPLWNPYNGLGTPLLANYQSALVYPFTWIIFLFYLFGNLNGLVFGHLFVNILHLSLAGIGIIKICEDKEYSAQASVISALSFSLGGYLLARFGFFSMIWAAAWFPWIFLYTERVSKSGKFSIETVKLSGVITLLLLSGHAQLSWYIIVFSGIYLLFRLRKPFTAWIKPLAQFILANLLAAGLASIQLVPTAELLLHSQRSAEVDSLTSMTYSFWPWHFLNFLNPHIFGHPITGDYWGYGAYWEDAVYIGLLPVLLGITAVLLYLRKKKLAAWDNSDIAFFMVTSLVSLIFSLGSNTAVFPWLYKYIPTFDMFNAPARYIIWFVFSISILAGSAFDLWRKPQKRTLYWVRLGTAGGFAIGLGALFMLIGGGSIKPTFIKATFEISVLMILIGGLYLLNPMQEPGKNVEKSGRIWKWAVVCFVVLDLFYMNMSHIPVQKISNINVFAEDTEFETDVIYLPEVDDYEFRYNTVLNFDDFENTLSGKQLAQSNLANVNIFSRTESLNNFEPMRLASYDQFINVLNKNHASDQIQLLSFYGITGYGKLNQNNPSIITYKGIEASERIQFYSNAIISHSTESIMHELGEMPCVYLLDEANEKSIGKPEDCRTISAEISNLVWDGNLISFDLNIPENAWVLISDTFDTGWNLKIDDRKATLHKANGFIKAFEVSRGKHSISLTYLPDSVIFGSLISLASLILMCILVYRLRKTQH